MMTSCHQRSSPRREAGFTLVEAIVTIVITGILAGITSMLIVGPMKGYLNTVVRGGLSDTADLALRRLTRETRQALPNSLRISSSTYNGINYYYIEFIATSGGGAYTPSSGFFGSGSAKCATTAANCQFTVNSPMPSNPAIATGVNGDFIVIDNSNVSNSNNAYACGTPTPAPPCNIAQVASISGSTVTLSPGSTGYNVFAGMTSSSMRFQVVPNGLQAVTFACPAAPATGNFYRYWNYGLYATTAAAITAATAGPSAIMASSASCSVSYPTTAQSLGLFIVTLTLTDTAGDSITLMREIHVDNTP